MEYSTRSAEPQTGGFKTLVWQKANKVLISWHLLNQAENFTERSLILCK
jgi:hypothetical protein